jgi:hypothetical protein
MNTYLCKRWIARGAGVALLTGSIAAHAAIGAKVLLQEWSPLTPKQQSVRVIANDPAAVSDAVQTAWTRARPLICKQLLAVMGRGGAAGGQTLYDIKCLLDETAVLTLAPARANTVSAWLAVGGYVEATSTTPTALGSYADPRVSLALKATLHLAVSVQPDPNQPLRVDVATFALSDASIDSHNFSGDVLKFVTDDLLPFFKGPKFRQMAESAINGLGVTLTTPFNQALAPVNAKLRGPSGAVRVAVWGKPDAIVIAFGPRPLTPPNGGTMFGALRWDAGRILAPGSCDSFSIAATVQTGPAPLVDPGGYFEPANAPMQKVGTFQLQPSQGAECRYRMTGLANGWPNEVVARSSIDAKKNAGNSLHRVDYHVSGDGWDGHNVVPQPSAERNYRVQGSAEATAVIDAGAAAKRKLQSPGDPVMNPLATKGSLGAKAAVVAVPAKANSPFLEQAKAATPALALQSETVNGALGATSLQKKAGAVSLNPQPLPPAGLATPAQAPSALR